MMAPFFIVLPNFWKLILLKKNQPYIIINGDQLTLQ